MIEPILPELRRTDITKPALAGEFSSAGALLHGEALERVVRPLLEAGLQEEGLE